MRSRSEIHMLMVAAARADERFDEDSRRLAETLRRLAGMKAGKKARGEDARDPEAAERQKQTDRRRTLFNILPDSREKTALKEAMLQYAYDLMWDGHCAAVDAVTEFLPSDDVNAMLDAWEQDQRGDGPKSRWYGDG